MTKYGKVTVLLFCLILVFSCVLPVKANSAMTFWTGTDASGSVTADENCPVEAVKENLSFSLPDPATNLIMTPGQYRNRFTAEYTFENTSDQDVQVLLSFPAALNPYGAMPEFPDSPEIPDQYRIEVNGMPAETVHRYTWLGGYDFDLKRDLSMLKDGYTEDSFFKPDTDVWKYTWQLHIEEENSDRAVVSCTFDSSDKNRRYRIQPYYRGIDFRGNQLTIAADGEDGTEFSLYVFGDELSDDPEWQLMASMDQNEPVKGSAQLKDKKKQTYEEYVLSLKPEGKAISDTDWYNAMTAMYDATCENDLVLTDTDQISGHLLHWLQYELHFEPHEQIVNAVSAPIYPSVNTAYDYPVFGYTYLLSPASSWKDFKALDISVETPMEMIESSLKGFEKTDTGYHISVEGLPKGELEFSLCEVSSPKKKSNPYEYILIGILAAGALLVILLAVLLIKLAGRLFRKS